MQPSVLYRCDYGMLKGENVLVLVKDTWELLVPWPSQRNQKTFLLVAAGLAFGFSLISYNLNTLKNVILKYDYLS